MNSTIKSTADLGDKSIVFDDKYSAIAIVYGADRPNLESLGQLSVDTDGRRKLSGLKCLMQDIQHRIDLYGDFVHCEIIEFKKIDDILFDLLGFEFPYEEMKVSAPRELAFLLNDIGHDSAYSRSVKFHGETLAQLSLV